MSELDKLPPLREVVRRFDLGAKKNLGQNFIFDLNLTDRIARAAGPLDGVTVVEIGPGPGGLTRSLLAAGAARVIAVERDERFTPALQDIAACAPERLLVVAGDALEIDLGNLAAQHGAGGPTRIVANLPYNVAVPLLTSWLERPDWPPWFDRLTLMFQREVAERIVAGPHERSDYGRLSVLCGWRTRARILFDVPPAAFTPPPKVTSSVVELTPRLEPAPCDLQALAAVTQAAFGQRRKMLRQSLRGLAGTRYAVEAGTLLDAAGLDPTRRAEQLSIDEFVELAKRLVSLSADGGRPSLVPPNLVPSLVPKTD